MYKRKKTLSLVVTPYHTYTRCKRGKQIPRTCYNVHVRLLKAKSLIRLIRIKVDKTCLISLSKANEEYLLSKETQGSPLYSLICKTIHAAILNEY